MTVMRPPRNFKTNRCYHLISRIAHRAFFLDEEERTRFVDRLWRVAQFSCVEVLAYCIMSNHFHVLVYVPERFDLSDDELFSRIRALYSGVKLGMIQKEWDAIVKTGGARAKADFRKKFLRRMWNVSEFMRALKQNTSVSFNCRRQHVGTMWESRFRAREFYPDEKASLMNAAGYIDRNPVKAKIVGWPDMYRWCSFAAACEGDERCKAGYRFIYTFAPLAWDQIKQLHEKSIHLVLKELEEDRSKGRVVRGLSVSEEKREKAVRRTYEQVEMSLPNRVPRILDCGNNRVAADILRLLADRARMPSELRQALGISSAHYFTTKYMTPLAKAGLLSVTPGCNPFSPRKTFSLTRKGRRFVG